MKHFLFLILFTYSLPSFADEYIEDVLWIQMHAHQLRQQYNEDFKILKSNCNQAKELFHYFKVKLMIACPFLQESEKTSDSVLEDNIRKIIEPKVHYICSHEDSAKKYKKFAEKSLKTAQMNFEFAMETSSTWETEKKLYLTNEAAAYLLQAKKYYKWVTESTSTSSDAIENFKASISFFLTKVLPVCDPLRSETIEPTVPKNTFKGNSKDGIYL